MTHFQSPRQVLFYLQLHPFFSHLADGWLQPPTHPAFSGLPGSPYARLLCHRTCIHLHHGDGGRCFRLFSMSLSSYSWQILPCWITSLRTACSTPSPTVSTPHSDSGQSYKSRTGEMMGESLLGWLLQSCVIRIVFEVSGMDTSACVFEICSDEPSFRWHLLWWRLHPSSPLPS